MFHRAHSRLPHPLILRGPLHAALVAVTVLLLWVPVVQAQSGDDANYSGGGAGSSGDEAGYSGGSAGDSGGAAGYAGAGAGYSGGGAGTGPGGGGGESYVPTGEIVADNGFRPDPNGFSFENYGDSKYELTSKELVDLFGEKVCIRIVDDECRLTPVAEEWMDRKNEAIKGGHCYGFSTLSLMLWKDQLPSYRRGGMPSGSSFAMERSAALDHNLAWGWAFQYLPAIRDNWFEDDPKAVLEQLIKDLQSGGTETQTLVFWTRDLQSGHAITPYGVESRGNGLYVILAYDNNYPNRTVPFYVDTATNTWAYNLAAGNPTQPKTIWEGDAQTETTQLAATTPGTRRQPCFFCAEEDEKPVSEQVNEISLDSKSETNHPNLLITDAKGRSTGLRGGEIVNDIPGAEVLVEMTAERYEDKAEPRYHIPVSAGDLKIRIDGRRLTKPAQSDLSIVGPGQFAQIDDIRTKPGELERMRVGRNANWVRYKTGSSESPNVGIGFDDTTGVSWNFAALSTGVKGGSTLEFHVFPKSKTVRFSNEGGKGDYSVAAFRDSERNSLDWGANFDIVGDIDFRIDYRRRARDANGKPGLPISWKDDDGAHTDTLDRDYQDE